MQQSTEVGPKGSLLANLSQQLAGIEKRDRELWMLVVGIGIVIATGLLLVLFPATFLSDGRFYFQVSMSKELFFGLVCLLVLFNLYIISRRLEFRKLRQQLVSSTLQSELLRLQSFMDPLTEIYNRRSLDDIATKYISRARRDGSALTFLMLDVDRFKQVNTQFGHLTGDVVLAEIASVLRSSVRGSDSVVRYGGDEFLIFLAEANAAAARAVVDRIHKGMDAWNQSGQLPDFPITLSIGTAQWQDGRTLDETLDAADVTMFQAKHRSSVERT